MGKGTPIPQYEKATSIPENSTYIADMGDGSGTKGVTQETLTKEVGKGLKVGNLEELQTEDKSSLVAAINEAAQSGGGSSVDILDSKEEIEANTESGKAAGALAVKEMFGELNDNLGGCSFGYTDDGEPGFRKPGADAVIPFSKKLDGNVLQYPFCQQNGIVIDTAGYYAFVCNGAVSTSNFDIMINGKTMHTVFAFQNGDYYTTLGFAYLNVGDIINKSSSVSGYRLYRIT